MQTETLTPTHLPVPLEAIGQQLVAQQVEAQPPVEIQQADAPELTPEQVAEARVGTLRTIVDEINSDEGTLSPSTRQYLREGKSLNDAENEIKTLVIDNQPPTPADEALSIFRQAHAEALAKRWGGRKARMLTREPYRQAVRDMILDTTSRIEATTNINDVSTVESMAESQLRILSDLVVAEEQNLTQLTSSVTRGKLMNRVLSNKHVRRGALIATVGTVLTTKLNLVGGEAHAEEVNTAVELLVASAYAHSAELRVMQAVQKKRASHRVARVNKVISKDADVADDIMDRATANSQGQKSALRLAATLFGDNLPELKEIASGTVNSETRYAMLVQGVLAHEMDVTDKELEPHPARRLLIEALAVGMIASGGHLAVSAAQSVEATKTLAEAAASGAEELA